MKVFAPTDLTLHDPPFEMVEGGRSVPYSDAPARVTRVLSALGRTGWAQRCEAPKAADRDLYIGGVHDGEYVDFLRTAFADYQREGAAYGLTLGPVLLPAIWPPRRPMARPQSLFARAGYHQIDLAAPIVAGTYAAACASVDCALAAADCVLAGDAAAFAVCRPPGHHAGRDFAAGFCYLNNAAIAAQRMRARGRVAIVDIDYHAGHGTQDVFYRSADVLTVSLHADPAWEYPFFVGHAGEIGEGAGRGYHRNIPLPRGTDDARYLTALDSALADVRAYGPTALIVSAGMDIYRGDPVGQFAISPAGIAQIGARLAGLGLPTVWVMEGGYDSAELGDNFVRLLEPLSTRGGVR